KKYIRHFGSTNNALRRANLPIMRIAKYGADELLHALKSFYNKYGRSPSANDFDKRKHYPSSHAILYNFSSWNKALRAAGLPINRPLRYDQDDLIRWIKGFVLKNKQFPHYRNLSTHGAPSYAPIKRAFGGLRMAIKASGYVEKPGKASTKILNVPGP